MQVIVGERSNITSEADPGEMVYAVQFMPQAVRTSFPYLSKINSQSNSYRNEKLILSQGEVKGLTDELQFLINLVNKERFLHGFDVDTFVKYWCGDQEPTALIKDLSRAHAILSLASETNARIVFSL